MHQELKRKGVTLQLLWEEYHATHGERAYRYSQFCWHYQRFNDSLARSMRQTHRAGEKLFIDYSGDTVPVINVVTGEILRAQIFVASMGASKYTYAEATWTQQLPDWIASHVRMFDHLGCVPEIITPDNLKSAIKKACRYEPEENSTYGDMARHFGCVIIAARPKSPKDKAVVENHVLVVQRWILARLRNRQFFSLPELNTAIADLLVKLNHRPFKKLPGNRAEAFESIDRPAMKPLPERRYEYAEWLKAKVGIDYYVEADHHYYSVPHQLVGEYVRVRMTASAIECLFKASNTKIQTRPRSVTRLLARPVSRQPTRHPAGRRPRGVLVSSLRGYCFIRERTFDLELHVLTFQEVIQHRHGPGRPRSPDQGGGHHHFPVQQLRGEEMLGWTLDPFSAPYGVQVAHLELARTTRHTLNPASHPIVKPARRVQRNLLLVPGAAQPQLQVRLPYSHAPSRRGEGHRFFESAPHAKLAINNRVQTNERPCPL